MVNFLLEKVYFMNVNLGTTRGSGHLVVEIFIDAGRDKDHKGLGLIRF